MSLMKSLHAAPRPPVPPGALWKAFGGGSLSFGLVWKPFGAGSEPFGVTPEHRRIASEPSRATALPPGIAWGPTRDGWEPFGETICSIGPLPEPLRTPRGALR